jgi:SAM-dependent methyltransferase
VPAPKKGEAGKAIMPTSDYHQISDVLHVVDILCPSRILDIGVGLGKWGFLCREVLDVYRKGLPPGARETRIDGIEAHEAYRNDNWGFAYDTVHIGDAFDLVDRLESYDLILCCDTIEHFEKGRGKQFLDRMLRKGRVVIVTSPISFVPQEATFGNELEIHRSIWGREDFVGLAHLYKEVDVTFIAVLSQDSGALAKLRGRWALNPFEVLGFKKGLFAFSDYLKGRVAAALHGTVHDAG